MRIVQFVILAVLSSLLISCAQSASRTRSPDLGTVQVRVVAKPKDGVTEPIARVAVYDAAPQPARADGQYERVDYKNLTDIILWVQWPGFTTRGRLVTVSPSAVTIEVNADKPTNATLPVALDGKVVVRNTSSRTVSLYSVSKGNEFDLPNVQPGQTAEFQARSEGLIEVLADPAQPPVAQVYVTPTARYARARAGETITFASIPPGEYEIVAWHPRLPTSSQRVTLRANETSNATIMVGVNALSGKDQ